MEYHQRTQSNVDHCEKRRVCRDAESDAKWHGTPQLGEEHVEQCGSTQNMQSSVDHVERYRLTRSVAGRHGAAWNDVVLRSAREATWRM